MRSLPRFSVENPVIAGVVMTAIILGGVYCGLTLVREMFPESRPNTIVISAPYPGATPAEVERGLALRIEEAIKDLEDIDKIVTDITEGSCLIRVEMTSAVDDIDQAVNDFKAAIDSIPRDELPQEAEEIRVFKSEPRLPVISVTVFGDVDEATLKSIGERLRDDVLLLRDVSEIELGGVRKAEITVDVAPEKLIEYSLSLAGIAEAIRQANLDLPGGQVRTAGQNVAVRTLGETDDADRIARTVLRATGDGRIVRIRDVGRVIDGFEDRDIIGRFNAQAAVSVTIYKTADQDAIDIAQKVRAFVAGKAHRPLEWDFWTRWKNTFGVQTEAQEIYERAWNDPYPPSLQILTHSNLARFIEDRLDLLKRNGMWGLALVFLSLLFFLDWRVALWVMMGLVISVCGALVLMKLTGATLNLISMFGLIVVLGLIVDDAIIVGENTFARVERGDDPRSAAIRGAQEVAWPVVTAVATTIGAFAPLLFIEGRIGDFMGILPIVVMCALGVSLFESLAILPTHLAETLRPPVELRIPNGEERIRSSNFATRNSWVRRFRRTERHLVMDLLAGWYERVLRRAVTWRYVTVAGILAVLLAATGLVAGGRVPLVFIPHMDSETVLANLDMPVGTPAQRTLAAVSVIEEAALRLPEVKTVWSIVGAQIDADETGTYANQRSHLAQVIIELARVEQRDRPSDQIVAQLRRRTANIPGVNALTYHSMQGGPAGKEIEMEVTGENMDHILLAAAQLKSELDQYAGVYDITDDYEQGRRELQIELLDSARPLGITTRTLATEIRGAFYGLEARTLQRGREDVDIRVRFPEDRRKHVYELEMMRIPTPDGRLVPFREVARLTETRGTAALRRVNQRRAVVVSADVDQNEANSEQIIASLTSGTIPDLEARYPGLRIEFSGNKREFAKSFGSLRRDFAIALIIIYFMLAALFRSYVQPLIVMTAVPFGIIGAVLGHLIMGYPLTILSLIGLVALTGIVVNDSLILVDFVNREVRGGKPKFEAVISGAIRRLRPILLTSMTTVLGLAPLLAETSFQARFLIPMAISISFGLAFATVLTLVVVPANYLILEDVKSLLRRLWTGRSLESTPTAA